MTDAIRLVVATNNAANNPYVERKLEALSDILDKTQNTLTSDGTVKPEVWACAKKIRDCLRDLQRFNREWLDVAVKQQQRQTK